MADPGTKLAKSDPPHDSSSFFSAVTQQGTFSSLQKDTFHLQFTCFSPLTALLTESTRTSIINPSSYALTSQTWHQMTPKSQNTSWKSQKTRAMVLEFEDRFYGSKMLSFRCSKLISNIFKAFILKDTWEKQLFAQYSFSEELPPLQLASLPGIKLRKQIHF